MPVVCRTAQDVPFSFVGCLAFPACAILNYVVRPLMVEIFGMDPSVQKTGLSVESQRHVKALHLSRRALRSLRFSDSALAARFMLHGWRLVSWSQGWQDKPPALFFCLYSSRRDLFAKAFQSWRYILELRARHDPRLLPCSDVPASRQHLASELGRSRKLASSSVEALLKEVW